MEVRIESLADAAARHQAQRLTAPEPQRVRSYAVQMNALENLKRVYHLSRRLARRIGAPARSHAPS